MDSSYSLRGRGNAHAPNTAVAKHVKPDSSISSDVQELGIATRRLVKDIMQTAVLLVRTVVLVSKVLVSIFKLVLVLGNLIIGVGRWACVHAKERWS